MTNFSEPATGRHPPSSLLQGASLFLDFDGTLVDIAPRPDDIEVSDHLRELLDRLRARLGGRVAILTGRSADDIERLIEPVALAIGGHHGLETRNGSSTTAMERPPILDELLADLRKLERDFPGIVIEDKPLGIAVHYRQVPEAEEACRQAVEQAAQHSGLDIQPGKMVFELKPRGANKGDALQRLMMQEPFAGTMPVFLGDDLTDEPAFSAAQALGGAGIVIGDREPSAARFRLDNVEAVVDWLEQACEAAR